MSSAAAGSRIAPVERWTPGCAGNAISITVIVEFQAGFLDSTVS